MSEPRTPQADTDGIRLEEPVIQAHHKGFPDSAVGRSVDEVRGLGLTDDGFVTPVLFLDEAALASNIQSMQRFSDEAGLSLSPHVKTSMSPEIIERQLRAGAWAVTVATPSQARTLRSLGARRVLIANEVVDAAGIRWLGGQMDQDPGFVAFCYVDSDDGVRMLDRYLRDRGQVRPVPVLLEVGTVGGRGGVRSRDEAIRVADLVHESRYLRLAGVGSFEGIVGEGLQPDRLDEVRAFLEDTRSVADDVITGVGQGEDEDFIVTVGGSAFFELVRDVFDDEWRDARPIRVVLRSGCYVTHDSLGYQQFRSLMALRCEPLELTPSFELWSRVISRPEPDLAILDFGKRDTSTDGGFPLPQHILRRGSSTIEPAPAIRVVNLNDQHAYVKSVPNSLAGAALELEVGDLVGLGISHPCTTFDKWRLIPVVDSDRKLVSAVRTLF